jgi:hypothetical protein
MATQLVSLGTLATIIIGLVISYFYVHYMWAALQKAVRTRHESDEGKDKYHLSLAGAIISVIVSSVAIAVYGIGPAFLYLGPVASLLSPIAVTYCLYQEFID